MIRVALPVALLLGAAPAAAQQGPRFCPNRPDLGTSTCTTDRGRVLAEVSALDWLRDDSGGERSDTLLVGDALLRTGIGARTEVQLGWTPLARLRTRAADGSVSTVTGVGDVRLGLRRNLRNPDGDGFSFALEGFVTVPTGTRDIGRGDWSAGAVLPVTVAVGRGWSLAFTGEVDAETDAVRTGHHPAAAVTVGVGHDLVPGLAAVVEVAMRHDADPDGRETQWLTAASLAWQVHETAQLDVLFVAGLNRQAPDVRVVVGGATLF